MHDSGYPSPASDARSCSPPAPPRTSQLPKDLRPTILEVQKHPLTDSVVKEVNDFFLEHWPFKTEKHRRRFVDEGYAWVLCLYCPQSWDDRIHWGCRLLTTGFLIDDLLDRMSQQDGTIFNDKVIDCCRGNTLPDRSVPAQWIMYDLFEEMRAVDKPLADALLQPTIDFLKGQVDAERSKPMGLSEYFVLRNDDVGKYFLSGIMRFGMGLEMSPEELELIKPAEENCMKHVSVLNDICSFEKEVLAAKDGFDLGAMCSSVPICMEMMDVNEEQAKRVMWEMIRAWEVRHFEIRDEILRKNPSPALAAYIKGLEYQMSGNELWSLLTPRYNRTGALGFTEGR
ncbi:terpenoid synthase [Aaosphaeria arxii CBS 175.79]|uniref:Terpene synthase n=1 Tax=Aaosphaeria arxii CBS 175.79 TaxID=1450172 RepID=A0A6A5Y525_9PLEO|nr:terpenoid synthase [Aaosphaeria arxii CBS 175.79]KAF2020313.1 terpenoid synthase [Aaosphaeria arxii CBS 175.79]